MVEAASLPRHDVPPSARRSGRLAAHRAIDLVPTGLVLSYPWLLRGFHAAIVVGEPVLAGCLLMVVFLVPAVCAWFAWRQATCDSPTRRDVRWQRAHYLGVTAPTISVFLSVVQSLLHSPWPTELVWTIGWTGVAAWAWSGSMRAPHDRLPIDIGRWRVLHGVIAAVVLAYVAFHLGNHLFGLVGPDVHRAVMALGRKVYRARIVEPILIVLFVIQVITGLRLAWRWSAVPADFHRVVQVASGLYLSVFILGHMNSVLVYAPAVRKIPTDWAFATGAPAGLIDDAWNIRLLPHYALGVFMVLTHLVSGLRVVMLAHGVPARVVDTVWSAGVLVSAAVAVAIVAGLCGVRIGW